MKIQVRDEFPFPTGVVFKTFRDRMDEYVKHTPNITDIQIKFREQVSGTVLKMQCDWGGMGQIPDLVRKILKPEMLRWEDWQTWDETSLTNEWVIRPYYFREFVTCHGVWTYEPQGENKCLVRCDGVFEVNITEFPPFPKWLVQKASPMVEKVIGGYIPSNMKQTFRAIKKFIAADMKKSGGG